MRTAVCPDVRIRLATSQDAAVLTDLAIRSKASWGYASEFLEARRGELTMTDDIAATWSVRVATLASGICGTISLASSPGSSKDEPTVRRLVTKVLHGSSPIDARFTP